MERKITDILILYDDGEMEIVYYHPEDSILKSLDDRESDTNWGGFEFLKGYEDFLEANSEKND
jgi:hypothetical protein